ncbi:MAG: energy-coupling factor ABC transporter ATP-binding protein [Spirochaetaceae bacterium]|jgi:biotin transport system ATP-binding protein|nr:energy-coupling factor ABC transporter ATP-binding protein [Spirochaetaceae bacterium]
MTEDCYAIKLHGITKTFRVAECADTERIRNEKFYALDNISLNFHKEKCTVISGANGSGKSLLMSIIAKLDEPSSGSLEICGKTALVFQEANDQILGETPREDVLIGIRARKIPKAAAAIIAEQALDETGLLDKADFPARFLSGGEKRRLAVAGALAMDADIIIFDEPYANLDYEGVLQVNVLISELLKKKKTVIILTHELEKCLALAQYFIVLYKGKIAFAGKPEDGLDHDMTKWKLHNPLHTVSELKDLVWL